MRLTYTHLTLKVSHAEHLGLVLLATVESLHLEWAVSYVNVWLCLTGIVVACGEDTPLASYLASLFTRKAR